MNATLNNGLGRRRVRAAAVLAAGLFVAGCQTVSNTANGLAMAAFIWTGILFLVPVALVMAPPALIFEGLDSHRAGVVQAEFSPDGETIVFTYRAGHHQRLYTIPADGGEPVPIRQRSAFDFDPVWSPDGSRIVFVSSTRKQRGADIYSVHPDGSGIQQHTDDDALELGPRFSPDGTRLVFSRWYLGERERKYVRASVVEVALDTGEETRLTRGDHFDVAPQYVGDNVVYVRAEGVGKIKKPGRSRFSEDGFWLYDRRSGQVSPLGEVEAAEIESYTVDPGPALRIVYDEQRTYTADNLHVLEKGPEGITASIFDKAYPGLLHQEGDPPEKHHPRFSPDGTHLLFTMAAGDKAENGYWNLEPSELHELNLTTGEARLLTTLGNHVTRPRYAPNGVRILFLLNERPKRNRERHSLWVMARDGSDARNLDVQRALDASE